MAKRKRTRLQRKTDAVAKVVDALKGCEYPYQKKQILKAAIVLTGLTCPEMTL